MLATPLARPRTVAPGEAAPSDEAAQSAGEAPGSARLRAGFLGARGTARGTSDTRDTRGIASSLVGAVTNQLANPLADPIADPIASVLVGEVISPLAPALVGRYAARLVGLAVGLPTGGQAARYLGVPVGWSEVRAAAVIPGACARTAGRVRFHRSGGLKTSHGSRLFKGEGPTGEDDAARAAGPPTG
ncbi:hypothetical protein ACIPLC_19405 [Kitasatospora sp. NPDC086801]|uniref:hypothetical protein n=1 Tax=Kitasatospora sp. NPDC086801 TaxID=3364066 RepID=UPI00382F3079